MSEEGDDKKASVEVFMSIFDKFPKEKEPNLDKKEKKELKRELHAQFLKGFLKHYREFRKNFLRIQKDYLAASNPKNLLSHIIGRLDRPDSKHMSDDLKNEVVRRHTKLYEDQLSICFNYANTKIIDTILFYPKVTEGTDKDVLIRGARNLGAALGLFLAGVEYGITFPHFLDLTSNSTQKEILSLSKSIRKRLDSMGKKVKTKFIKNRVTQIAKKHRNTLQKEQMELIGKISNIFA